MSHAYEIQRTYTAHAGKVPEREWCHLSFHRTREAAEKRLSKELTAMRKRCGAGSWDSNWRVLNENGEPLMWMSHQGQAQLSDGVGD